MKVLVIGRNRAILESAGKVLIVYREKDDLRKVARRWCGIARYERTCTKLTPLGARQARAWKVPGTREHGKWSTLQAQCERAYNLLKEAREVASGATLTTPTAGTSGLWY